MHYLTSRPQHTNELLLRLRTAIKGQIILVRYSHFIVHERLLDYRLNIGSIIYGNGMNSMFYFSCYRSVKYSILCTLLKFSRNIIKNFRRFFISAANELAQSQLCPFVTSSERECIGGGGWWRKGCQQKGVLTATNRADDTYPGLNWGGKRLSAVQMLIRPRGYMPPPKKPI